MERKANQDQKVKRFMTLSCSGGNECKRWMVSPGWDVTTEMSVRRRALISEWSEASAIVESKGGIQIEDMPWSIDNNFIISDRFRKFLEREAPGHAQFLGIRFTGPAKLVPKERYWLVNWLKEIDCLDRARSMEEGTAGPYVKWVVIDPARVPDDVLVGYVVGALPDLFMRGDLIRKIKKAGVTGPQFRELWYSTDADAPPPSWRPGRRRPESERPAKPWPGYR